MYILDSMCFIPFIHKISLLLACLNKKAVLKRSESVCLNKVSKKQRRVDTLGKPIPVVRRKSRPSTAPLDIIPPDDPESGSLAILARAG